MSKDFGRFDIVKHYEPCFAYKKKLVISARRLLLLSIKHETYLQLSTYENSASNEVEFHSLRTDFAPNWRPARGF